MVTIIVRADEVTTDRCHVQHVDTEKEDRTDQTFTPQGNSIRDLTERQRSSYC